MRRPISTNLHGYLDFLTAGLLAALPKALGMGKVATALCEGSAIAATGYSLMTRYEKGLVKALPMKAHLTMDALSGGMLIGAAVMLDEEPEVRGTLAALGAWEIAAALMTETESPQDRAAESLEQYRYTESQHLAAATVGPEGVESTYR